MNIVDNTEQQDSQNPFRIILSGDEKEICLQEIIKRLKKIIYVYERSQEPNSNYNYKVYCGGVLIYISSSNILFNGELVNIIVNLNAIMTNNFSKAQLKRIVFESVNYAQYMLSECQNETGKKEGNRESGKGG